MYIVKYQDAYGRVCFGQVESPLEFFADRIATGKMSSKALKECEAFEATPINITKYTAEIQDLVEQLTLLTRVKNGGVGTLAELVNKKELSLAEAALVRKEIIKRWPFDSEDFRVPDETA